MRLVRAPPLEVQGRSNPSLDPDACGLPRSSPRRLVSRLGVLRSAARWHYASLPSSSQAYSSGCQAPLAALRYARARTCQGDPEGGYVPHPGRCSHAPTSLGTLRSPLNFVEWLGLQVQAQGGKEKGFGFSAAPQRAWGRRAHACTLALRARV